MVCFGVEDVLFFMNNAHVSCASRKGGTSAGRSLCFLGVCLWGLCRQKAVNNAHRRYVSDGGKKCNKCIHFIRSRSSEVVIKFDMMPCPFITVAAVF